MARYLKCEDVVLPEEEILDCIAVSGFSSPTELMLTDRRVVVGGPTAALGSHFSLIRGMMVGAFPLEEYRSYVIGTGKRPLLFLIALALAVGGAFMLTHDVTRQAGLYVIAGGLMFVLAWSVWRKTYLEIESSGLKVSGRVNQREAVIFVERLQLAALAAKAGYPPEDVAKRARLSGKPAGACADERPCSPETGAGQEERQIEDGQPDAAARG